MDGTERDLPKDFSSFAEHLQLTFEQVVRDHATTRLLIWESLELEEADTAEGERRTTIFRILVEVISKKQTEGLIPSEIEPELLTMTVLGLSMLLQVLPMYVRSIFGLNPNNPKFIAKWKLCLTQHPKCFSRRVSDLLIV